MVPNLKQPQKNYLLDKEFSGPVPVVILSILNYLGGIFKISDSCRYHTACVQSTASTFLAQLVLIFECPCFIMGIICCTCCFIVRTEDQPALNIIFRFYIFFLIWASHLI